ncbi:MAG: hypothetical protein IKS37_08365 [Solobacterium sp.]|nr:hypothetical protein [Solobacterium sp.]
MDQITDAALRTLLQDAGCSEEDITAYLKTRRPRILDDYRRTLVENIHVLEQKIRYLDYLEYCLQKKG